MSRQQPARRLRARAARTSAGPVLAPVWTDLARDIGSAASDRLADVAHRKLEELIVTLELPPGSLWSEVTLSERIGIGRTPVREAVQRLAWERLVTVIPRHGIRISEIDVHEQMLVVEMRRELERLVATRAARRATVDERRRITLIADSFHAAGETEDTLQFLRLNFDARQFAIACARNPFAANAFGPINALTRRFYFVYQREAHDLARAAELHADLLRGIASGDESAAAAAADRIVDYAEHYTKAVIIGRG